VTYAMWASVDCDVAESEVRRSEVTGMVVNDSATDHELVAQRRLCAYGRIASDSTGGSCPWAQQVRGRAKRPYQNIFR